MTVSNSNFYILHLTEHPGQNEDNHYPIYHLIICFRMIDLVGLVKRKTHQNTRARTLQTPVKLCISLWVEEFCGLAGQERRLWIFEKRVTRRPPCLLRSQPPVQIKLFCDLVVFNKCCYHTPFFSTKLYKTFMCRNINKIKLKLTLWEWVDVNRTNGDVFDLMIDQNFEIGFFYHF